MKTTMTKAEMVQSFIETLTDDEAIDCIEKDGGVEPVFVFQCIDENNKEITFPLDIPIDFMKQGRIGKEIFMQTIFPTFKKFIREERNCTINCIAFISEAWKQESKIDELDLENVILNETNSKEIVHFTFNYEGGEVTFFYDVVRIGQTMKLVNKEVVRTDYAKDKPIGRFQNLLA